MPNSQRFTLAFAVLALIFTLQARSFSQINDAYLVNYYTTGGFCPTPGPAIFEQERVINTGQTGTPIDRNHGAVCVDVYVFDFQQEMVECCSCRLTANGLAAFDLCGSLLNNPLTGQAPDQGVVKIVADQVPASGNCDPTNISSPVSGALRAWRDITVQSGTNPTALGPILSISASPFLSAPLTSGEQSFLGQACAFVQYLGSGKGRCDCSILF